MKKILPVFVLGITAVLVVSGCIQQQQPDAISIPSTGKNVTVETTSSGFNPNSILINTGDTVVFVNIDSSPHWPVSNIHPTHQEYPGFDAKNGLLTGEKYSFTFTREGSFGFHDHLNPGLVGTITVE